MLSIFPTRTTFSTSVLAGVLLFSATTGPVGHAEEPTPEAGLGVVPMHLPDPEADGVIYFQTADGKPRATTLIPEMQAELTNYLVDSRSPIAALVVADVQTGSILAMVQGRSPEDWGGKTHTALHSGFPAASLFKTVVTTAAFEIADMESTAPVGLNGGCSHVRETGEWLKERTPTDVSRMSLRRAFGASCNGFFAKIGVNNLGLGIITDFARRFGWETGFATDFKVERSPFRPPSPTTSSTHTVGRFAAGFGKVGLSAVHAAHVMITIANQGRPRPLRIFKDTPIADAKSLQPLYSESTSEHLMGILDATVKGGTASFAFRRGKYRRLRDYVGGKTGTLTGTSPKGLTTWFAGMAPVQNPEIVVASVVMLDAHWHIKAPNLAAEGIWEYYDAKLNQKAMNVSTFMPIAGSQGEKKTRRSRR
jgi:cell division protein FtsI/penicillin-binding protein 2